MAIPRVPCVNGGICSPYGVLFFLLVLPQTCIAFCAGHIEEFHGPGVFGHETDASSASSASSDDGSHHDDRNHHQAPPLERTEGVGNIENGPVVRATPTQGPGSAQAMQDRQHLEQVPNAGGESSPFAHWKYALLLGIGLGGAYLLAESGMTVTELLTEGARAIGQNIKTVGNTIKSVYVQVGSWLHAHTVGPLREGVGAIKDGSESARVLTQQVGEAQQTGKEGIQAMREGTKVVHEVGTKIPSEASFSRMSTQFWAKAYLAASSTGVTLMMFQKVLRSVRFR